MKLKQIKPKDLLKALLKLGFIIKRQKGSHVFLERSSGNAVKVTSISLHNKPLPKGTLRNILTQTDVKEKDIADLL